MKRFDRKNFPKDWLISEGSGSGAIGRDIVDKEGRIVKSDPPDLVFDLDGDAEGSAKESD